MFRRHVDDVHRFLRRRTRDDALADDLTAQVFERCWGSLATYEAHRGSMRPWLLRIAANAAASHYRSDARRRDREHLVAVREQPLTAPSLADPPGDAAGAPDDVLAVLGGLPVRHQEVLALRFLADLSTEEAAAALGISRNHFAVLQHRAVRQLRAAWRRRRPDDGSTG